MLDQGIQFHLQIVQQEQHDPNIALQPQRSHVRLNELKPIIIGKLLFEELIDHRIENGPRNPQVPTRLINLPAPCSRKPHFSAPLGTNNSKRPAASLILRSQPLGIEAAFAGSSRRRTDSFCGFWRFLRLAVYLCPLRALLLRFGDCLCRCSRLRTSGFPFCRCSGPSWPRN